jgi:guanine deaminase
MLSEEEQWLGQAVGLALENVAAGGQPFGALVIMGGKLVATGVNRGIQDCDPTAHAELVAIREACRALEQPTLPGALLVASCEPCPMCQAAAVLAGVERVVYAATGIEAAAAGFDVSGVSEELAAPFDERRIPLVAVPVQEQTQPFEAWTEMRERREHDRPPHPSS